MKIKKFENYDNNLKGLSIVLDKKEFRIGFNFKSIKLVKRFRSIIDNKFIFYFNEIVCRSGKTYRQFELRILFLHTAYRKEL